MSLQRSTSSLLINEPPIPVLPSLAVKIGLNESIFLQQVHFWLGRSNKTVDGRRWIYNSSRAWCEQLPFWCERTIKTIIGNLRDRGLILTANMNAAKFDKTLWYTIDYDALEKLSLDENRPSIVQYLPNDEADLAPSYRANLARPIPENETTTREVSAPAQSASPDASATAKKSRTNANVDPVYAAFHTGFFAHWASQYKATTHDEPYSFSGGMEGNALKRSKLFEKSLPDVMASIDAFLRITERQDKYLANHRDISTFLRSWNHRILANARVEARQHSRASPNGSPTIDAMQDYYAAQRANLDILAAEKCGKSG